MQKWRKKQYKNYWILRVWTKQIRGTQARAGTQTRAKRIIKIVEEVRRIKNGKRRIVVGKALTGGTEAWIKNEPFQRIWKSTKGRK